MSKKSSESPRHMPTHCQEVLKAFLISRRVGGLFHNCRLANYLQRAGFEVKLVEKLNHHGDVWRLVLWRGKVAKDHESDWAKVSIRQFLKRNGINYPKQEICTLVKGKRITVAFNWVEGRPGTLRLRKRPQM